MLGWDIFQHLEGEFEEGEITSEETVAYTVCDIPCARSNASDGASQDRA